MTVGRIDILCEGVSGVEIVKVWYDNMSPSELFRLSGLVHTTGEVGNIPLNELMRQGLFLLLVRPVFNGAEYFHLYLLLDFEIGMDPGIHHVI